MTGKSRSSRHRFIWGIALFLVLIGAIVVMRRTLFLLPVFQGSYEPAPSDTTRPEFPEEGFTQHPLLTLLHILPGLLFIVLGLLQFSKRLRIQRPRLHRWNGRLVLLLGIIIGVSGILMGFKMAISGISEIAAATFYGILFLFALLQAYRSIRQKNISQHREWMIRAFAIGLAVTTTRPIVGIFFATGPLTGLTPKDFFGTALWIGFTLHLIGAEWWINRTRQQIQRDAENI